MLVNTTFLLIAIALLWFPRQWMRLGFLVRRRKRRTEGAVRREEEPWKTEESGNPAVKFSSEFSKLRNYVDLLRAIAGSVAMLGGFDVEPCLRIAPDPLGAPPSGAIASEIMALQLGVLLIGVLIQTVRYERKRLLFFAPIFFLAGLTVGLCGPQGAFFAFVMIWTLNPMLKNPLGFLTIYAAVAGAFGLFFQGLGSRLPYVAIVLCFLPALLSLLAHRPLVLFTRKGTRSLAPHA